VSPIPFQKVVKERLTLQALQYHSNPHAMTAQSPPHSLIVFRVSSNAFINDRAKEIGHPTYRPGGRA
jgi:hypothetical protein